MDLLWRFPDINGPFRGSHALAAGWLTQRQLRSSLLVRLFRDVYIPRGMDVDHLLRCHAASLIAPPEAMLTGLSAAAVHGLDLTGRADPVELVVPPSVHFTAQPGLNVRRLPIDHGEYEPWAHCRLATPMRRTLDILTNTRLRKGLPRVVGYLDAVLRAGVVDRTHLAAVLATRHDHGIVRARRALDLADPRAESIPESEVRVWLTLGGLPPDVQYHAVDSAGRFLGRLDLAYGAAKVAVEYDGEWHLEGRQPDLDARRRARLEAAGWVVLVITRDQLYTNPQEMVEMARALLRARLGGKMSA